MKQPCTYVCVLGAPKPNATVGATSSPRKGKFPGIVIKHQRTVTHQQFYDADTNTWKIKANTTAKTSITFRVVRK
jgi:hypothetical protein